MNRYDSESLDRHLTGDWGEDSVPNDATPSAVGPKPLRCPYCGDTLTVQLVYVAMYSEHRDLDGFECDNTRCNATWDKLGNPGVLSGVNSDD